MAVFPGSIYSQLPQYHDGRAPAWGGTSWSANGGRSRWPWPWRCWSRNFCPGEGSRVDRERRTSRRHDVPAIALDAREPQTVAAHHPSKGHAAGS